MVHRQGDMEDEDSIIDRGPGIAKSIGMTLLLLAVGRNSEVILDKAMELTKYRNPATILIVGEESFGRRPELTRSQVLLLLDRVLDVPQVRSIWAAGTF